MKKDQIGKFIKELRLENKMSQEELSNSLHVDRTLISKWENGKVIPDLEMMNDLCSIFNIELDEIIYGERKNKKNNSEIKNNLFDYILNKETKYRRIKIFSIILVLFVLLISFCFLIYYFSQTYNKTKIYKVYLDTDDYTLYNGLYINSLNNQYLKLGNIYNNDLDIDLLYIDDNNEILLYEGDSNDLIINVLNKIKFNDFNEVKDKIYIKINNKKYRLMFTQIYSNKFRSFKNINSNNYSLSNTSTEIPLKIKNTFVCEEDICYLEKDNYFLIYSIYKSKLLIQNEEVRVEYDLNNKAFHYYELNNEFILEKDNIICISKECKNEKDLYRKYYDNYIKDYVGE